MTKFFQTSLRVCVFLSIFMSFTAQAAPQAYIDYCNQQGGFAQDMAVQYTIGGVNVLGETKPFCTLVQGDGYIVIGLEAFASEKPSFAATYIKSLGEIDADSSLWEGEFFNPSVNVCKNLGGASISYLTSGGFVNPVGQSDICVFGDGSMVSGWSLIYIANHREGYDLVKDKVRAAPLPIPMPQ